MAENPRGALRSLGAGRNQPATDAPSGERLRPVSDEAVSLALTAAVAYQKDAREVPWVLPSSGQVRAMLEGAYAGLVAAAARAAAEMERAEAAEAKLAALRTVLLEGGQSDTTVRRRALAIIGSEEEGHG